MTSIPHLVLAAVLTTASPPLVAQEAAEADDTTQAAAKPDPGPLRTIEFEVDEGTWMFLDVSPDGRTIVFDLLGDLYTVPIDGGGASVLLGGRDWDHMPRYSPDGDRIAFISDRDGMMNLWTVAADGSDPKQYSKARTDPHLSPFWTPDGQIMVRKEGELWTYYPEGGSGFKVDIEGSIQGPAVSPDGRYIFYSTSAVLGGGRAIVLQPPALRSHDRRDDSARVGRASPDLARRAPDGLRAPPGSSGRASESGIS